MWLGAVWWIMLLLQRTSTVQWADEDLQRMVAAKLVTAQAEVGRALVGLGGAG